jgi:hypothetical protein
MIKTIIPTSGIKPSKIHQPLELGIVEPAHHDGEIGNNGAEPEQGRERRAAKDVGICEQVQHRGDYAGEKEK